MKIKKGDAGYIRSRKIKILLKTIVQFGIVIALLVLGIVQTGDKMNVLTIVAILGCLPASKTLVELIMFLPYKSIDKGKGNETKEKAPLLTFVYDMIFTSEKNIMPVDAVVISGNTIFGYSSSKKINIEIVSQHMKQYLNKNQFDRVSVKVFDSYTAFLTRAEGLNNIKAIEKTDTKEHENGIKQILLNISL